MPINMHIMNTIGVATPSATVVCLAVNSQVSYEHVSRASVLRTTRPSAVDGRHAAAEILSILFVFFGIVTIPNELLEVIDARLAKDLCPNVGHVVLAFDCTDLKSSISNHGLGPKRLHLKVSYLANTGSPQHCSCSARVRLHDQADRLADELQGVLQTACGAHA